MTAVGEAQWKVNNDDAFKRFSQARSAAEQRMQVREPFSLQQLIDTKKKEMLAGNIPSGKVIQPGFQGMDALRDTLQKASDLLLYTNSSTFEEKKPLKKNDLGHYVDLIA